MGEVHHLRGGHAGHERTGGVYDAWFSVLRQKGGCVRTEGQSISSGRGSGTFSINTRFVNTNKYQWDYLAREMRFGI